MKQFEQPKITVEEFSVSDIVTASSVNEGTGGNWDTGIH